MYFAAKVFWPFLGSKQDSPSNYLIKNCISFLHRKMHHDIFGGYETVTLASAHVFSHQNKKIACDIFKGPFTGAFFVQFLSHS